MLDIQHFVIRYRLGLQDTDSLVRAADALLAEGHTEPAVIELSILESPTMAEAGPIFERVCKELGVTIPTKDEAVYELLRIYLKSIASGAQTSRDGLSAIMREVYFPYVAAAPCKQYVGDSHGMEHLVGAYWAYDDLTDWPRRCSWKGKFGAEAVACWEQSVREYARDWLERYDRLGPAVGPK